MGAVGFDVWASDELEAFQWTEFQRNMRLIDCLSAPDRFGEAMLGLALLFPQPFQWFRRCNIMRRSLTELDRVVRAVLSEQPDLLQLAQDLLPYAKWMMNGGEELPVLEGVEDI